MFDSDWITAIVSKVHNVTGYQPKFIMEEMSLTAACYYYCQYARIQGVENIARRMPEEIAEAQDNRSIELILDRLEELGVIKAEDKEALFTSMKTNPDNK